ncbi:hypothetical protein FHU38_002901 [Saccharomonospora amisosensis]|uniref:Uncharacterized protein n=1 Tax=Saccharomonospora amisosensis TaxID=1128677 RepID=A0A7X5UQW7_9PSEU|nr:hypothetical protein [Saccharomonospora amisosensis]
MRHRLVAPLAVGSGGEVVIEHEGIPGKSAIRCEADGDTLERTAPVAPGRQMLQRPVGAAEQRRGPLQSQVTHIARSKFQPHADFRRCDAGSSQHRRGRVDPDHGPAGGAGERYRYAPTAYRSTSSPSTASARSTYYATSAVMCTDHSG